jgi:hypothetical protein
MPHDLRAVPASRPWAASKVVPRPTFTTLSFFAGKCLPASAPANLLFPRPPAMQIELRRSATCKKQSVLYFILRINCICTHAASHWSRPLSTPITPNAFAAALLGLSLTVAPLSKVSAAETPAPPRAETSSSSCQGLDKPACEAKDCTWVRATTVNGKPRKAYCRRKPQKQS